VARSGSPANIPVATRASAADVALPGTNQFEPFVDLGSEPGAIEYYARSAEALGEDLTDIGQLLDYCGYKEKTAFDLLRKDVPAADKEILAVPYFAPKITNVADPKANLGWRKVIRLKVRPGSHGAQKNVATMYLLFNVFLSANELETKSPFIDGSADNNQAILVQNKAPNEKPNTTLYWYVFGTVNDVEKSGKRIPALNASFDARDPADPKPVKPYFVPGACVQCHNGEKAKVNYVDTDHLYDRVQPKEDFERMRPLPLGVLLDGGKVKADNGESDTTPTYETAFDHVRTLNKEILAQNQGADDSDNFAVRAAANWVKRHENSSRYLPPIERPMPGRVKTWSAANDNDRALLPLLNRYCFRCHSAVKYNVLDKDAVLRLAKAGGDRGINARLTILPSALNYRLRIMPQDQTLDKATIDRLTTLVDKMVKEP
jgi:hypothetical protein